MQAPLSRSFVSKSESDFPPSLSCFCVMDQLRTMTGTTKRDPSNNAKSSKRIHSDIMDRTGPMSSRRQLFVLWHDGEPGSIHDPSTWTYGAEVHPTTYKSSWCCSCLLTPPLLLRFSAHFGIASRDSILLPFDAVFDALAFRPYKFKCHRCRPTHLRPSPHPRLRHVPCRQRPRFLHQRFLSCPI